MNPELGTWDDINEISSSFDMMTDLVVNHCSSESDWFKNYLNESNPGKKLF